MIHLCVQETIEWLARPENYDPDGSPPGLEGFDPVPFLLSSLPITASVMLTQLSHELGHRVAAFQKKVRHTLRPGLRSRSCLDLPVQHVTMHCHRPRYTCPFDSHNCKQDKLWLCAGCGHSAITDAVDQCRGQCNQLLSAVGYASTIETLCKTLS